MEEDLGKLHIWSTYQSNEFGDSNSFVLYLRHPEMSLSRVFDYLNPDAVVDFISIGGNDSNGTYTEHSIFMGIPEKPKNPLQVLKIMMLDSPTVSQLIKYLNETGFEVVKYHFKTSDNIICYNGFHGLTTIDVRIEMPVNHRGRFTNNMLAKEPQIGNKIDSDLQQRSYYVYEGDKLVAIFPEVWHIDDFLTKGYKDILDIFQEEIIERPLPF